MRSHRAPQAPQAIVGFICCPPQPDVKASLLKTPRAYATEQGEIEWVPN